MKSEAIHSALPPLLAIFAIALLQATLMILIVIIVKPALSLLFVLFATVITICLLLLSAHCLLLIGVTSSASKGRLSSRLVTGECAGRWRNLYDN
jgi:hypothetical protein